MLRKIRGGRKLAAIADEAGVNKGTLSKIERGVELPAEKDIEGLERAYGVPVHEWYEPRVLTAVDRDRG